MKKVEKKLIKIPFLSDHLQHPDEPGGAGEQGRGGSSYFLSSSQVYHEYTSVAGE